ncbi:MAG: efflux RND transporter periplasmic adaptor subunit [Polyangiaceae bacterium]|jgi:cobalt-zinc-cadmium efflux system membrane fusion protein|nr:efflux RND transporter periplasmic adaptor subunit [Polyangiaceae bacterium]
MTESSCTPGVVVVLLLALLPSCREASAEKKPLPEPPYQARGPGQLGVRPDLFAMLSFTKVEGSSRKASLTAFGRATFAPGGSYAVRAPGSAFVERVLVTVGEQVEEGQTLARLRSVEVARLRADLKKLSVLLKADEEALARVEAVAAQGAASPREVAELKAKIAGERAEMAGVQGVLGALRVGRGGGDSVELKASQGGQVLSRGITPGERIPEGAPEPAFLIGDPSRLVVRGSFPERDAPLLARDASCWFGVPALGSERFEGVVSQVIRAVDPRTQTIEVFCSPRQPDPRLSADMAARVEVDVGASGALLVPRGAVLLRKDDRVVFVRAGEGLLERRKVQIGLSLGDSVQVIEGLKAGEEVVSKNAILLDGELDEVL